MTTNHFEAHKAMRPPKSDARLVVEQRDGGAVLSIPRGGSFAWAALPTARQLAQVYVGFTAVNGVAMAVLPTIAATLYGSAFDESKESLLAILLLERQGDAVFGTSILLYISTFTEMPLAKSVAWSTVPYVLSLIKFLSTGRVTTLGFDSHVEITILASLVLPMLNILIGGNGGSIGTSILALVLLLYGAFGSISPVQSASVEGLDITSCPGM
jgi:hypothetical protein